jgi:hypothetical protein
LGVLKVQLLKIVGLRQESGSTFNSFDAKIEIWFFQKE